ncbi:hypothetical protein Y011_09990 [Vibrio parahaemolyticus VP49]|nr:hypothetical protein Y011_09990 [Vibrio parahaemolyticus VP49]
MIIGEFQISIPLLIKCIKIATNKSKQANNHKASKGYQIKNRRYNNDISANQIKLAELGLNR